MVALEIIVHKLGMLSGTNIELLCDLLTLPVVQLMADLFHILLQGPHDVHGLRRIEAGRRQYEAKTPCAVDLLA